MPLLCSMAHSTGRARSALAAADGHAVLLGALTDRTWQVAAAPSLPATSYSCRIGGSCSAKARSAAGNTVQRIITSCVRPAQAPALDALATWLVEDTARLEPRLLSRDVTNRFVALLAAYTPCGALSPRPCLQTSAEHVSDELLYGPELGCSSSGCCACKPPFLQHA